MWQEPDSPWWYRFYGFFLHITFLEFTAFYHTVHMIKMFQIGDIKEWIKALILIFTLYAASLKSIWFLTKVSKIKEMMNRLEDLLTISSFGRDGESLILKAYFTKIIKVLKFYYGSTILSCTIPVLIFIARHKTKYLPYETSFFWDYKKIDGIYWALGFHQSIAGFMNSMISYNLDIVFIIFIGLTTAAVDELSHEVASVSKSSVTTKVKVRNKVSKQVNEAQQKLKKLHQCIELHMKLKNFSSEMSKHLSFAFLIQAFMSTVILCTAVFILTGVRSINNI